MTSPAPGPTSSPAPTAPAALLDAAQAALAAEYQAVWGYPVLGPRLTDPAQIALARAADDAHTTLAATVADLLSRLGSVPVTAFADYPLPAAVTTPAQAAGYAVTLETGAATTWRYVVVRTGEGADVLGLKAMAVDALVAGAVRAAQWRATLTPLHPTVAFPGT